MIFGIKRTGTFIPSPRAKTLAGNAAACRAALIARDRGCIRCGMGHRGTATPTTSSDWKDGGRN